jgi:hypothetical protein
MPWIAGSESDRHWPSLGTILRQSKATGLRDARIAASGAEHGVTTVLSADRDFRKFPGIRVQNPLRG